MAESVINNTADGVTQSFHTMRFWAFEITLGVALAIWTQLWQPRWADEGATMIWYQGLVPFGGLAAGLALVFIVRFLMAPYIQRNEARKQVATALTSSIAEEVMTQPVIQGRTFRIADLVHGVFQIKDRTFINCAIHGPAALLIAAETMERVSVSSTHFQDCDFGTKDVDTLVWETKGLHISAAIPVIDTVFQRCRFYNIAFITSPNTANQWREVFRKGIEAKRVTYEFTPPPTLSK